MAQQVPGVDRSNALYERIPMTIGNEPAYSEVKRAVETSFAPGNVEKTLKTIERAGLRVRDFEAVLPTGALGQHTPAQYAQLPDGDQGMVRELYLALLEQIDIKLRNRFFKLYAYY
jgi:hypothetical protein